MSANNMNIHTGGDATILPNSNSSATSAMTITNMALILIPAIPLLKLIHSYLKWYNSPLWKIPGPSRKKKFWLFGEFFTILKEPFLAPVNRWWKEASRELTAMSITGTDSSRVSTQTNEEQYADMIHYSYLLGKHRVFIFNPDIVHKILSCPRALYASPTPRFLKGAGVDAIKEALGEYGLVQMDGKDWYRHRRIINPSFQTRLVRDCLNSVAPALVQRFVMHWRKGTRNFSDSCSGSSSSDEDADAKPRREIDVATHLSAITLDIIGLTALSCNFNAVDSIEHWSKQNQNQSRSETNDGNDDSDSDSDYIPPVSNAMVQAISVLLKPTAKRILFTVLGLGMLDRDSLVAKKILNKLVDQVIINAKESNCDGSGSGSGSGSGLGYRYNNRDRGSWEIATPSRRSGDKEDQLLASQGRLTSVRAFPGGSQNTVGQTPLHQDNINRSALVEANEEEFDRQFYLADDDEFLQPDVDSGSGNNTMGRFLFESNKTRQREADMERQHQNGQVPNPDLAREQTLRFMKEKDENASVSSPVKRVMSMALSQRSLPMAGDLNNDSITGYNDELSDMTIGRRWARTLSSGCCCISDCYNPSHIEQDEEEDTSKSEPSLDKAWEYFEHQTLPRCLAGGLSDSILGKYDRAEIGEHTKKTMLYPVWSTPMKDMADFGIGVGLYFSTLRFLAILSLFAACINIPNMFYFASEDYDVGRNGNQLDGIREKAKSWLLLGTAVCSNTQWEMCLSDDCGEEYWGKDTWQSFPGTEDRDRLTTGTKDDLNIKFMKRNICNIEETSMMYGPLICSTVIIVMTAIYYWIYSQKKRIELFDNAEHSSTDYTIEINNPPKTDSSLSPDVWKKWFEVTFDDMEVAACTIALDNEQLIQALANRRSLIMKLQNELERPEDFDIDHMDDIVNHFDKMPKWKRIFCFAASPKRLVEAIKNQTAVISTLSEKDYAVASVFVTFQTQVQQKEVLGKLLVPAFCSRRKLDYKKYIYEGTILKVSEPAEPSAIHWWDLNVAAWKRSSKRFITTLISFAMILISIFVIGYLRSISSALSGYAITVFNLITPKVVTMLTMLESHPNTSSFSASQYLKVTAFRWTNTVLINNVITSFTDTVADDELIKSIMVLFILELSLKPVLQYLDIWGALQRHFFAPRATHQRKMNLCFKSSAYDIGERSTNVTTILFFTLYYAAIFPCGFIFAFVIFSQMYWSDKYSILRQWRQGPKIGTSIAKMTNIFFLIAIAVYAILTFNFYAMFPFDNVCEYGRVDQEYNYQDYLGTWELNITSDENPKKFDLESIEITQKRSYTFCNQNILRKITFPPTPANLLRTSDDSLGWLSDNRKTMATALGWIMILTVAIIISTIALKTIVQFIKYLFFADYKIQEMTEEKRSELKKLRFCDIEEIKAYVPQITIDGYTFPFLLCDVDEIDKEMIGWSNPEDPESNYDAHNLIFDIPKVADEKNAMREDPKIAASALETFVTKPADENYNAPLFSIVKSWKAVEKVEALTLCIPTMDSDEQSTELFDNLTFEKTRENIEAGSRA